MALLGSLTQAAMAGGPRPLANDGRSPLKNDLGKSRIGASVQIAVRWPCRGGRRRVSRREGSAAMCRQSSLRSAALLPLTNRFAIATIQFGPVIDPNSLGPVIDPASFGPSPDPLG